MARTQRIEFPGAWYHVIVQGNGGRAIVRDDRDRKKLLSYFERAHEKQGIVIHAFCVMDNHFHLLLETPDANLSAAMRLINASYSTYFNHTHERKGRLFQGRYRAIVLDPENFAKEVACFIHLNPVRANICECPEDYPWSSYRAYVEKLHLHTFLTTDVMLESFDPEQEAARNAYKEFVDQLVRMNVQDPCTRAYQDMILGDDAFVERVMQHIADDKESVSVAQNTTGLCERVEGCIMQHEGVDEKLRKKLFIYYMRRTFNASVDSVNAYLASPISAAAISKLLSRLEKKRAGDTTLDAIMQKIEAALDEM